MNEFDWALWTAACMTGILGSGHCFAMCGGIAGSLGAIGTLSRSNPVRYAFEFNLARLLSYGLLGSFAAAFVGTVDRLGNLAATGTWLRLATAIMVALLGMRFLFNWRGLDFIERAGIAIWSRISPLAMWAGSRKDGAGRVVLGLCWGFLPCGLVYSALLTAASTGRPVSGCVTMLFFGVGTLPSMLGLTLAAPGLYSLLSDRTFRRFVGLCLLILAVWMTYTLTIVNGAEHMLHSYIQHAAGATRNA
jgi:sulfite exporter TauE/SafE